MKKIYNLGAWSETLGQVSRDRAHSYRSLCVVATVPVIPIGSDSTKANTLGSIIYIVILVLLCS